MNRKKLTLSMLVALLATAGAVYAQGKKEEPSQSQQQASWKVTTTPSKKVEMTTPSKQSINGSDTPKTPKTLKEPPEKRERIVLRTNEPKNYDERLKDARKLIADKKITDKMKELEDIKQNQKDKLIDLVIKNGPYSDKKEAEIKEQANDMLDKSLKQRLKIAWDIVFAEDDPEKPQITHRKLKEVIKLTFDGKFLDELPIPHIAALETYVQLKGYQAKIEARTSLEKSADVTVTDPTLTPKENKRTEKEIYLGGNIIERVLKDAKQTGLQQKRDIDMLMSCYKHERSKIDEPQTPKAELELAELQLVFFKALQNNGLPIPKKYIESQQLRKEKWEELVDDAEKNQKNDNNEDNAKSKQQQQSPQPNTTYYYQLRTYNSIETI